jgi:hypothetical protein
MHLASEPGQRLFGPSPARRLPCSATAAAVSVVAAFSVVIFAESPSAVVTAVRTSITPVPPECKWILPAIDDGESSAMELLNLV